MHPTWPLYARHDNQGQSLGIQYLSLLINWGRLFADHISCSIMLQIFGARFQAIVSCVNGP